MAKESIDRINEAIQTSGPDSKPGALVTTWVLIAEWIDPDGELWLTRLDSGNSSVWKRKGMLHDALFDTEWDREAASD